MNNKFNNAKKGVLILATLFINTLMMAQTLSPQVSPSSGGYYVATPGSLSWTLGQTFNTTLTGGSNKLTQGFQQPEIQLTTGTVLSSLCLGAAVTVPFTALGVISPTNVFTAQLSDASGSFASPVAIGSLTGNTSGSISATIPTLTPAGTGYRIRVVSSTTIAGTNNGSNIAITNCAVNTWTGAVSTAWAAAGNWSLGIPSCSVSALIPGGLTRYPVVSAAASVNNLTINSGATLTINTGQTLSVCGNWSDSGTAAVGAGTVLLQGTGSQTLSGYTLFTNLTVNGNYTVGNNAGDKIAVNGILTKTGGTLSTNNNLSLLSTSAKTAMIVEGAGTISGNANIQRYIAAIGYHDIGSPINGGTISNITGVSITGTDGAGSFITSQEGTLQVYRESTNTHNTLDSGYYNFTGPSDALVNGQGMTLKVSSAASTMNYYGAPGAGNVSINITKLGTNSLTTGWNQLGNPYPAPLSWTNLKAGNAGVMNAACYIWKPTGASVTAGSWQTYNGSNGVGGANDLIALGQGFMVLKNTAGTSAITFTNSMRFTSLTPVFNKSEYIPDEIRLTLTQGDNSAEILSYTDQNASLDFDNDQDALLPPAIVGTDANSFAFISQNTPYLINVFDKVSADLEFPLLIHAATAGTYTISAASLNVNNYPVWLHDKAQNMYYDLATQNVNFSSPGNEDKGNYSVVFKKDNISSQSSTPCKVWSSAASVNVSTSTQGATIEVYDMLGKLVTKVISNDTNTSLPIVISGVYMVRVLESNGSDTTKKVLVKEN